mgnify:CR=1 FL=1
MTSFLKNKPKLSLQVPSDDEYSMDLGETTNETYTTLSPLEIDSSSDDDSVVDVINPDFKKLLNHTVNVENINNFGQQIENKKIKRTYARSLKKNDMLKGKGLPVTLNYFLNSDTNPPIFTKVFLFSSMDESHKQSILNKVLSEIHYHNQFEEIRKIYEMDEINYGECLFKMPTLGNYGFIEDKSELLGFHPDEAMEAFYIQMSVIPNDYYSVSQLTSDTRCELIKDKLLDITDCLERNNLFHNDIHRFNVFVNDNNDIFLIDFGEAQNEANAGSWEWSDQLCNFIKRQKRKRIVGGTRKKKCIGKRNGKKGCRTCCNKNKKIKRCKFRLN